MAKRKQIFLLILVCLGVALCGNSVAQAKIKKGWVHTTKGVQYINAKGRRVTGKKKIKGNLYYFNKLGIRKSGWVKTKKGKKLYYGRKKSGRLYSNGVFAIGNRAYRFNKAGKCIQENVAVVRTDSSGSTYFLEPNYLSDTKIKKDVLTEEDFFTALVYAEAGGQGRIGMEAVAMVCLNRLASSHYPNDLRMMIYQKDRFGPAQNGNLGKILADADLHAGKNQYYEAARQAVRLAKTAYATKNRYIEGFPYPSGKTEFDYIYFMTPKKFAERNLSWTKTNAVYYSESGSKTKGHVFFSEWVEN